MECNMDQMDSSDVVGIYKKLSAIATGEWNLSRGHALKTRTLVMEPLPTVTLL